jgi:rhamnogalacturonan lyase-like protein
MRTRAFHIAAVASAAAATALAVTPSRSAVAAGGECGLPTSAPVWIDYGEASVKQDTRSVFAKPGVVVASSGTTVPPAFRAAGAATAYFELNLPRLVGAPSAPADAAGITATADTEYDRAVKSTGCATPWILLNELQGSNLTTPWSTTNAGYRANILALVQELAHDGAHPALLVQGNPAFGGDAGTWWKTVSQSSQLVYEAYYDGSRIYALGSLIGSRRMRLGMRLAAQQFESVGVPAAKLGFMLGFHSAQTAGIGGRQGLQPTSAWLRVVKWEALAAQQVARDDKIPFLSSWGWGTFGPDSVDPDKPLAACTWLWARDPKLCDAPQQLDNRSRLEGPIVLPPNTVCTLGDGRRVTPTEVAQLTKLTRDANVALTAQFVRAAIRGGAPVSEQAVLNVEQHVIDSVFHGKPAAYDRALAERHADRQLARGVIADTLRREAIAKQVGSTYDWIAARLMTAANNAICANDVLPGAGRPLAVSNDRDIATPQLNALLPFLFRDHTAPATPAAPTVTRTGTTNLVTWTSGHEADLAGYDVYRDGTKLTTFLPTGTTAWYDLNAPADATYTVQAIDTSGNRSPMSPQSTR